MGDFYRYLVESFSGEWVNKNQLWAGSDDHEPARVTEEARANTKEEHVKHHPAIFPLSIEEKLKEIRIKLEQKVTGPGGLSTGLREKFKLFDRDRRGRISTRAFIAGVRSLMIAISKVTRYIHKAPFE